MASVAAIVLAAGSGARFAASGGVGPKALAHFDGAPMVRRAAESALRSRARPVVVVTGAAADVAAALAGLDVRIAHNPRHAEGLSTSLRAGLEALPESADGALILLADMPGVDAPSLDALIAAFEAHPGAAAVVPTHGGRRGNPALLARATFAAACALEGDQGAGALLKGPLIGGVVEWAAPHDGVLRDADTAEALRNFSPVIQAL